jgi:hypothetical protein
LSDLENKRVIGMEPFLVNMTKPESKRQLNFLIRKEFKSKYWGWRKPFYYLIGVTSSILVFATLTPSEIWVTLKAVSIFLIGIVWVAVLVFFGVIVIRWFRMIRWRNRYIETAFKSDTEYLLAFDDDKLIFSTPKYRSEVNWSYYRYYAEDEITVYIIPEANIYQTISLSSLEIDKEYFDLLKKTVKLKLTPLQY